MTSDGRRSTEKLELFAEVLIEKRRLMSLGRNFLAREGVQLRWVPGE